MTISRSLPYTNQSIVNLKRPDGRKYVWIERGGGSSSGDDQTKKPKGQLNHWQ
jgi:hypothetical protein